MAKRQRKATEGRKPEAVRDRAIMALLSEKSVAAAAERAGIGERTLCRWLAEDEQFKQRLAEGRRTVFDAAMSRVQALSAVAIETLAALLAESVSDSVRLGASRTLAELGIHQRDAETILRKLDEIEAAQRQQAWRGR